MRPHASLQLFKATSSPLQPTLMHSYPSIQVIPTSTRVSGVLDPQAPEYWPALVQYVQHMDDQPLIPYPFYYSPYPYTPNCCYEQYSPDLQHASMSIYHNNMFIYLGSSPMEVQATMSSYYASPTPGPGNYNYPFCSPPQLPFSRQVASSIEDKPRGKETKKVASAGPKYKKRMERHKSTWVGTEEGCSSARRCMRLSGAESVLVKEGKTTVMVKNIPNKYTREMLLKFLDQHCVEETGKEKSDGVEDENFISAFDFVYLPIDFITGCNLGYAFVNFTDPRAALRFYGAVNNRKWDILGSKKVCEITIARIQGKEALGIHFNKSVFLCESDEFLPIVFSPYRHGTGEFQSTTIGRRVPRIRVSQSVTEAPN